MLKKYNYFSRYGWSSNPFTLTIKPDLLVGYSKQINSLLSHILNFHKIAVIIGPTGSGKTTILNWLSSYIRKNDGFKLFYAPKPPTTEKGIILFFKSFLGYNLIDKFRYPHLNINDLPKFLKNKISQKTIFLIDEAHECSLDILQWFRTLNDVVPNMSLIFAALPAFEKKINSELPTLSMRVTTKVYLESLSNIETESLIKKRIEDVGGSSIDPFTSEAITKIYDITGGFPREIIKKCDTLVKEASQKNIDSINKKFVEQSLQIPTSAEPEKIKLILTKKQTDILSLLSENKKLSPAEIVSFIGTEGYKSKNHAVRSINNILRRLMKDKLLKREKLGNTYLYFLTGKAKTLFTKA